VIQSGLKNKPKISNSDLIRLSEAFKIGEEFCDKIWKDWNKAPFSILLVTSEYEFLIRHPNPPQDFTLSNYEPLFKSNVYFRKRIFQTDFLATFPVNGIPTIVVGQPENTSKTSTEWVVTLFHEHFHQLQYSQSTYYSDVNTLNLSRGDETGMWMLNFPFPYDSSEIKKQFSVFVKALSDAVKLRKTKEFKNKLSEYLKEREIFKGLLSKDDYKYFSFQIWQEGISRYTEYKIAKLLGEKYKPTKEFKTLSDFTIFEQEANSLYNEMISKLEKLSLEEYRRIVFYDIGFAEALLLDEVNPKWQGQYFTDKFFIEKYFVID
jgi:hypothetical protein